MESSATERSAARALDRRRCRLATAVADRVAAHKQGRGEAVGGGGAGRCPKLVVGALAEADGVSLRELGAAAVLGGDVDGEHQLLADGEAEARARRVGDARVRDLGEEREELGAVRRVHAHAGVLHLEAHGVRLLGVILQPAAHPDRALLRELDGVGEQVQHYLAQAQRVAHDELERM